MKLWLLQITDREFHEMPYDKRHLCVVEAEDEAEARCLADDDACGGGIFTDRDRSNITELTVTGTARMIAVAGWPSG